MWLAGWLRCAEAAFPQPCHAIYEQFLQHS
jgi:hypothetical protein